MCLSADQTTQRKAEKDFLRFLVSRKIYQFLRFFLSIRKNSSLDIMSRFEFVPEKIQT